MGRIPEFVALARQNNGIFRYESTTGKIHLDAPRSALGRAIYWLRERLGRTRSPNPAASDARQHFVSDLKGFYGENVFDTLGRAQDLRRLTGERPVALQARKVRRLFERGQGEALRILQPALAQITAAPHDIAPFWKTMSEHKLLNSEFLAHVMEQVEFPPDSEAQQLRELIVNGFFRGVGAPPELLGRAGNRHIHYDSRYVGSTSLDRMEGALNLRGEGGVLGREHFLPYFDTSTGALNVEAFWNSEDESKSGRQTMVHFDIARNFQSSQFTINGKKDFATPQEMLTALWDYTSASKGDRLDAFIGCVNLLSQNTGSEFFHILRQETNLREHYAVFSQNRETTRYQNRTDYKFQATDGKLTFHRDVNEEQTSGTISVQEANDGIGGTFALPERARFERRTHMDGEVQADSTMLLRRLGAVFSFDSPLANLRPQG